MDNEAAKDFDKAIDTAFDKGNGDKGQLGIVMAIEALAKSLSADARALRTSIEHAVQDLKQPGR